jgi:hypothetical protein
MKFVTNLILLLFLAACANNKDPEQVSGRMRLSTDSIIGSHEITSELAGLTQRKRAKQYYVIVSNDTSDFRCSLSKSSASGRISINLRYVTVLSYNGQRRELDKLIPFALKDFAVNPDSLHIIFISRLMNAGDLAIDITKQYAETYGVHDKTPGHSKISALLMHSKLVSDWNEILQPYSISVDTVFAEKISFSERSELLLASTIETDSTLIPEQILDCMVWLRLKRSVRFIASGEDNFILQ